MPFPKKPEKRTINLLALTGQHSIKTLSKRFKKTEVEVRRVFERITENGWHEIVETPRGVFLRVKKPQKKLMAKKTQRRTTMPKEKLRVAFRRRHIIDLAVAGKNFEEVFEEIFRSDKSKKSSLVQTISYLIHNSLSIRRSALEKLMESYEDYRRKLDLEKARRNKRFSLEKQKRFAVQERHGNLDPLIRKFYEFALNPKTEKKIRNDLRKIGLTDTRFSKFFTSASEAYMFFIFGRSEIAARKERGINEKEISSAVFVLDKFAVQHNLPTISTYAKAQELLLGKKFGEIIEVDKHLFMAGTQILFLAERP